MPDRDDDRALLIYDGDCAFCRTWIDIWRRQTGETVVYAPSQEITKKFPDIPREKYQRAVQLIDANGRRYEGAEAVFRTLARTPGRSWIARFYEAPLVAPVSEWVYRFVAQRRGFFLRLTHLLWGSKIETPRYGLTARIFLQALAVVYFIAFVSWIPQLPGLIGENGILPAGSYLAGLAIRHGAWAFWIAPTFAWLAAHAGALQFMAITGALASLLALGGIAAGPCFLVMWALYLSIVTAGQGFSAFQWDNLLLEAGFLAIFLAPFRWRARYAARVEASPLVIWLYRFLLFRLMFSSGAAKLLSGDSNWRNLTALTHYFETQPLPTPLAWYAHALPAWLLKISTLGMFAIELVVPFLFFMPRRARYVGAAITAVFQIVLMATGNFAFFNWLTLTLCLLLLDDSLIERVLPRLKSAEPKSSVPSRVRKGMRAVLGTLVIVLGVTQLTGLFVRLPRPALLFAAVMSPFRIVNGYGLFSVMMMTRPEIVIEGSSDGDVWQTYVFRSKPSDVKRAPLWIAPFQPRLDWQMWFAALSEPDRNPWFMNLMIRILQGSQPVVALFKENPFPDAPPKYVRAVLYQYRFTTPEERKRDGAWWRREMKAEYVPAVSIESFTGGTP